MSLHIEANNHQTWCKQAIEDCSVGGCASNFLGDVIKEDQGRSRKNKHCYSSAPREKSLGGLLMAATNRQGRREGQDQLSVFKGILPPVDLPQLGMSFNRGLRWLTELSDLTQCDAREKFGSKVPNNPQTRRLNDRHPCEMMVEVMSASDRSRRIFRSIQSLARQTAILQGVIDSRISKCPFLVSQTPVCCTTVAIATAFRLQMQLLLCRSRHQPSGCRSGTRRADGRCPLRHEAGLLTRSCMPFGLASLRRLLCSSEGLLILWPAQSRQLLHYHYRV